MDPSTAGQKRQRVELNHAGGYGTLSAKPIQAAGPASTANGSSWGVDSQQPTTVQLGGFSSGATQSHAKLDQSSELAKVLQDAREIAMRDMVAKPAAQKSRAMNGKAVPLRDTELERIIRDAQEIAYRDAPQASHSAGGSRASSASHHAHAMPPHPSGLPSMVEASTAEASKPSKPSMSPATNPPPEATDGADDELQRALADVRAIAMRDMHQPPAKKTRRRRKTMQLNSHGAEDLPSAQQQPAPMQPPSAASPAAQVRPEMNSQAAAQPASSNASHRSDTPLCTAATSAAEPPSAAAAEMSEMERIMAEVREIAMRDSIPGNTAPRPRKRRSAQQMAAAHAAAALPALAPASALSRGPSHVASLLGPPAASGLGSHDMEHPSARGGLSDPAEARARGQFPVLAVDIEKALQATRDIVLSDANTPPELAEFIMAQCSSGDLLSKLQAAAAEGGDGAVPGILREAEEVARWDPSSRKDLEGPLQVGSAAEDGCSEAGADGGVGVMSGAGQAGRSADAKGAGKLAGKDHIHVRSWTHHWASVPGQPGLHIPRWTTAEAPKPPEQRAALRWPPLPPAAGHAGPATVMPLEQERHDPQPAATKAPKGRTPAPAQRDAPAAAVQRQPKRPAPELVIEATELQPPAPKQAPVWTVQSAVNGCSLAQHTVTTGGPPYLHGAV